MDAEEYRYDIPMGRDNKVEVQQLFQLLGVRYILTIEATRTVKDKNAVIIKKQSLRRLDALEIQLIPAGAFDIGSLPINTELKLRLFTSSIRFGFSVNPGFPLATQAGVYGGFAGFSIVTEKKDSQEGQED